MELYKTSVILILVLHANASFSSIPKQDDIRNYLGTRTPYRWKFNKDDSEVRYPGCEAQKVWMMVRHGTRLPSASDIVGMNSTLKDLKYEILLNHKAGLGQLSKDQLEHLEKWYSDLETDRQKFLTKEGGEEMMLLAKRMQRRFRGVIRKNYDNETFLVSYSGSQFRYTATQRAQESAKHFALGLFGKKQAENVVYAQPTKVDPVLRFYKHCAKWQKQVKKNETTYREQNLFGASQAMNDSIRAVSERLGLRRNLTLDELVLMYKVCGYETAWDKQQVSPWCGGLDAHSGKNLEYYHDLKHYWLDGYGHQLSYRQACVALKNMFDMFRKSGPPHAAFYFAHSGTVLKLLAHLQLRAGAPLRAASADAARAWRATDIDCFASNIAFVLFNCESGGAHVVAFHQERAVRLAGCRELCPLALLLDHFHDSVYNCDYSDMCRLDRTEL